MQWFRLEPAPTIEALAETARGEQVMLGRVWSKWFPLLDAFLLALAPSVGQDIGDADATLTWRVSAKTQIYNTPVSVPRTLTLSTENAVNGAEFHVVRTAVATGAAAVSVGGLKNLAVGEWCDAAFNGTAWILKRFGSL